MILGKFSFFVSVHLRDATHFASVNDLGFSAMQVMKSLKVRRT